MCVPHKIFSWDKGKPGIPRRENPENLVRAACRCPHRHFVPATIVARRSRGSSGATQRSRRGSPGAVVVVKAYTLLDESKGESFFFFMTASRFFGLWIVGSVVFEVVWWAGAGTTTGFSPVYFLGTARNSKEKDASHYLTWPSLTFLGRATRRRQVGLMQPSL